MDGYKTMALLKEVIFWQCFFRFIDPLRIQIREAKERIMGNAHKSVFFFDFKSDPNKSFFEQKVFFTITNYFIIVLEFLCVF